MADRTHRVQRGDPVVPQQRRPPDPPPPPQSDRLLPDPPRRWPLAAGGTGLGLLAGTVIGALAWSSTTVVAAPPVERTVTVTAPAPPPEVVTVTAPAPAPAAAASSG